MSQICPKMVIFRISVYFAAILVTIATVKVKLIADFYTFAITCEKNLVNVGFMRNSPLMHVALFKILVRSL